MQHSIPVINIRSTLIIILHRLDQWKYQGSHREFNWRKYSRIKDNHFDAKNAVPFHKSNVVDRVINLLFVRPKAGYC